MKKILLLPCVLASCWLAACGGSAAVKPAESSAWAADEAAIRAAMQASEDAFNRGDLAGHLAIYDASVTFMTPDGPRPGVAPIEKAFSAKYFRDGRPIQPLRLERLAVRPLGRDAALVTGHYVLSGGGEPAHAGWFTTVWERTPAGWRCVHDHSS